MKKKMRKMLAMLLALAMAASMTACTTSSNDSGSEDASEAVSASESEAENEEEEQDVQEEGSGESKDKVVYAFPDDPGTLSPLRAPKSGYSTVTCQVFDALWTYDEEGNMLPSVCTEVEDVDSLHYRLHLRDDVIFSDGHLLTAEDVVYSLKMFYEDSNSNTWVSYIDVDNTVAEDDVTVLLALASENPFALTNLSNVNLFYQEAYEASEDGMANDPIGSGPYTLEEYIPGSYALYKARDDYWGDEPSIPYLEVRFISEASQRTTALQTGEVDIAYDILNSDYDALLGIGLEGTELIGDTALNAMFNCSEYSICADPVVRQAISYAINNEGLLSAAYGGFGEICYTCCSNGMVNLEDTYMPDDYYTYDPETAKALLEEAGIENGTELTIMVVGSNAKRVTCAEIIQSNLQDLGLDLDVQIKQIESAVSTDMMQDASSGWDLYVNVMNTAGSKSSLDLINLYCYTLENLHFTNEEGAALSAEAINSTDPDVIHEGTMAISQIACEEVPYYSIITEETLMVQNPDLNLSGIYRSIDVRGNNLSWK